MKTSVGIGLMLCVSFVWTISATPSPQSANSPSTYSAYTGTDPKPLPPPPALGPANVAISDPTFGTQILRVTDENTQSGQSFISIDAGFFRAWNADSTAIKLTGPHGDGYWLEFDPSTFKVGNGSSQPVVHPLPFGARWEWSTIDPDIIYYLNGSQIARYNKATGVSTNLAGPSTGDPVGYMAVGVGRDYWVCAAAGPGIQDTWTKIFCVNPTNPSITRLIDIVNKTINGVPQGDPSWPTSAPNQVLGIHSISGGIGASWLEVTFHQQSWGANGGAVFNLSSNTWTRITNADIYWSGHVSMGNGKYANSSGSINGLDSRGMVLRNPDDAMNSGEYRFIAQPPSPWNGWCDADHSSWLNSVTNPNAPILISRYGESSCYQHAWAGEIDAAAVDGSNTVWRFAHTHNSGSSCYYGEAFAQISNDGRWALFSSPWDGTLGSDTAFGCSNRIDAFIVDLTGSAVITSHPSSQTVPAGSPVTFSVRATSPSPLRYQWQRNAADIPGATAADYTIAAVGPADNGARVRAMVTNDVSSVLSNEAVLTVTGGGGGSQTLLTTQAPAVQDISNGRAYELGVRVMSDVAGQITAVRFWKGAGESDTHTGHVWTATGQLLATVIFTNESASGWQAQPLVPPVAMAANVEYVVSVSTPPNHLFVVTQNVFAAAPLINGHLRAPAGNNGVYGAIGAFPTGSYDSSNYFRDLTFVPGSGGGGDTTPPVSITQPSGGTVGGMVTIAATSADNIGVAGLQFQVDGLNLGSEVPTPPSPSGISWDSTSVANGSHLLTAVVHDAAGNYTSASVTVTVANQLSSQTLLTTQTPALQDISNGRAYELGVRVLSDVAGQITALRFWKGANEGSTHTGHVWTATGQLLATVTFSNESVSGWQQQSLATPVSVAANTEYVVSVTTPPNDLFVVTQNVFAATPLVNGHLRALAGNNGVFGPIGTFPAGSYDSSNYFRDLVFVPQ
jgi:hypothetical protein